jgi:hypothetical protein
MSYVGKVKKIGKTRLRRNKDLRKAKLLDN